MTPEQGTGYWDGDPARIVDTLVIDRDVFSSYLGLPTDLEDGSRNPALDREIVGLMPLDLRAGRGGYENPSYYQLDLRLRYRFQAKHKAVYEAFLDVYNVLNRQEVATEDGRLATETGVAVTPENIADRSIYTFRQPLTSQSPRRMFLGFRASF